MPLQSWLVEGELAEWSKTLYALVAGIVELHQQLLDLLRTIHAGGFIQTSLESFMRAGQGQQLMLEGVAILGALLLAMDRRLPGAVRERAVVMHVRISGGAAALGPGLNSIMALAAASGRRSGARAPEGWPTALFMRLPLPESVVLGVVSSARSNDVYNQVGHWPAPEHRTSALAYQASLLYLALYFVPHVLHQDTALMRTLVDKHFADSWVISWGPGLHADLAVEWDGFRAARSALATVASPAHAKELAAAHAALWPKLQAQLDVYVRHRSLEGDFIVSHMGDLLACLRACNASLRWSLLHLSGTQKKLRAAVSAHGPSVDAILALLLDTAVLEHEVRSGYGALLEGKKQRWGTAQEHLTQSLEDLAHFYAALQSLPRARPSPHSAAWFSGLLQRVEHMGWRDENSDASAHAQAVAAALDDLQRFPPPEAALQTAHFVDKARGALALLLCVADVWKNPAWVVRLRSLLAKVSSLLEIPLLRMCQAQLPEASASCHTLSTSLLDFANHLLQVVPEMVIATMEEVAVMWEHQVVPLEARVSRAALKSVAQHPNHIRLAQLAARIAQLSDGIRTLHRSRLGVLALDAQGLLEACLARHLSQRLASAFATALSFPMPGPPLAPSDSSELRRGSGLLGRAAAFGSAVPAREDLLSHLQALSKRLHALRGGLVDMADTIAAPVAALWDVQLQRVMSINSAKDAARFSRARSPEVLAGDPDGGHATFVGRLLGELLRLSDPVQTQYQALRCAWVDAEGAEVLGLDTFDSLRTALRPPGLAALDHLLACRLAWALKQALRHLQQQLRDGLHAHVVEYGLLGRPGQASSGPAAVAEVAQATSRHLVPLMDWLAVVGQMQLLRKALNFQLRHCCRLVPCGSLPKAVWALDQALIAELQLPADGTEGFTAPNDSSRQPESFAAAASSACADSEREANLQPPRARLKAGDVPQEFVALVRRCGFVAPAETQYIQAVRIPELPQALFLVPSRLHSGTHAPN
ncbi:hypothetical protein WJX73_001305 [Symbiochloris irregularis]|uniref:Uncharacterized protein n=1 Tax=Symbiochloris irregularis TaxID=706552 RepID=A0AAW1NS81_9CHLO